MKKSFDPIYTIINPLNDQGPSGGQIIVIPTDPEETWYDPANGRTYFYDAEGEDGAGWYWFDENGSDGYAGTSINTEGMINP